MHPNNTTSDTLEERFWTHCTKGELNECWEWRHTKLSGYGCFMYCGKLYYAHRVSWAIHNGSIPENMFVCHNCPNGDNRACFNPAHLWLGTLAENNRDKIAKGAQPRGEKAYRAKLTASDVIEIRELHKNGMTQTAIAKRYSMDQTNISDIVRYITWKHIP